MEKIYLSHLNRDDVKKMIKWGKHLDPRFYHYNFDITTENGFSFWYKSKKKIFQRKIYKVENENHDMVGFITIKNINWITRFAEMGIVFDSNNLNKGYGSSSIKLMLEEFFEQLNMNELYLRVAKFNVRAYKSYLKAGFVEYKREEEPFENQRHNTLLSKKYDDLYLCDDVLYTEYIYMHVTYEMYKNRTFCS